MEVSEEKKKSLFLPITTTASLSIPTIPSKSNKQKVMLKPGRSLMDWIRLTHSGKDLSGTGGKCLEVSVSELSKHNTAKDAWISIRGRVYNVTHYIDFHPGGDAELMRGVGTDATELFNEVHRWVNAESMLEKCFVGILKKSWTFDEKIARLNPLKCLKNKQNRAKTDEKCIATGPTYKTKDQKELVFELGRSGWHGSLMESSLTKPDVMVTKQQDSFTVAINCSNIKENCLITDLVSENLYVRYDDMSSDYLVVNCHATYDKNYNVDISDKNITVVLKSLKLAIDEPVPENHPNEELWNIYSMEKKCIFWPCELIKKLQVNHNTYVLTFQFPEGTKMWVPMGCHVQLRHFFESAEILRSYTPITFLCDNPADVDPTKINFMIKIYHDGKMSQILNRCNIGESVDISNFSGSFSKNFIQDCDDLVLLAAGTGITPMIKIINFMLAAKPAASMLLLFFNRSEKDILWKEELEECQSSSNKFKVLHVLSEANESWHGHSGLLNDSIIKELLTSEKANTNVKILICGPLPFTETAVKLLEESNFSQDRIYAFTGS